MVHIPKKFGIETVQTVRVNILDRRAILRADTGF